VALPNLVPRPTSASNTNRALFAPTGASFGTGTRSFLRVPDRFCANILTAGTPGPTHNCNINTDSPPFSYTPGRTVTVFQFPDDNPGSCFTQCEPTLPGCTPAYQELEYKVQVDGGNSAEGDVLESNEKDDEASPMGSL